MLNQYVTENDLKEFENNILFSIAFGAMTIILQFDSRSISINDELMFIDGSDEIRCDRRVPSTLTGLFELINCNVLHASFDENYSATFKFEGNKFIKILSNKTGYESYVINTKSGSMPVY